MKLLTRKNSTVLVALVLLTALIYGFAAANVVPETGAGDGSGTVSGYTISNVDWDLVSGSPSEVESVSFDVSATSGAGDASEVHITVDGGTTWVTCSGPSGNTWTCSFGSGSEPSVAAINSLQVVAVE